MSFKNLIFEKQNGIETITINRPKSLNVLNCEMMREISQLMDAIAAEISILGQSVLF